MTPADRFPWGDADGRVATPACRDTMRRNSWRMREWLYTPQEREEIERRFNPGLLLQSPQT
jgi:hypothetical protein